MSRDVTGTLKRPVPFTAPGLVATGVGLHAREEASGLLKGPKP